MKSLLVLALYAVVGVVVLATRRRQRSAAESAPPGFIYAGAASRASRAPVISFALSVGVSAVVALAWIAA